VVAFINWGLFAPYISKYGFVYFRTPPPPPPIASVSFRKLMSVNV
jgi:hypothetical protein